jgi:hypothetical protein
MLSPKWARPRATAADHRDRGDPTTRKVRGTPVVRGEYVSITAREAVTIDRKIGSSASLMSS